MDFEKIATSAVEAEISKTDRLSSFINSGDKEPCWDGNIYIHENKLRTKKDIKKIPTQVKGKSVTKWKVQRTVTRSITYDDLYAYMQDGGVFYFVVYIDKSTGTPLQIYYIDLLPIKIKEYLKIKKKNYSIKCRKFPTDKLQKTELLLNFYDNSKKQSSFVNAELPSIEELKKEGILESLSFQYTSLNKFDSHFSLPKMIDGKSITIYANIKGGVAPIPVEYVEEVSSVIMHNGNKLPVSVNGVPYYFGFKTITTTEQIEHCIGSSVRLIYPNAETNELPKTMSVKIHISGTLNEQITSIKFVSSMIEHRSFSIGAIEIPIIIQDDELKKFEIKDFPEYLKELEKAKSVLSSMHVKKDLQLDACTDEDIENLNFLVATVGEQQLVRENPVAPVNVRKLTIANITVAVVYLQNEGGGYGIWDFFDNHFCVHWCDGEIDRRISQFSAMTVDELLMFDNLNLKFIVDDYKLIKADEWICELGNSTMLELLKAYDRSQEHMYLEAAKELLGWLIDNEEYISKEVNTINKLQIALREGTISYADKAELYSLIENSSDDFLKMGAFLILNEQKEFFKLFSKLEPTQQEVFRKFPIYKFYNPEGNENGQA